MNRIVTLEPFEAGPETPAAPDPALPDADRWAPARSHAAARPFLPLLAPTPEPPGTAAPQGQPSSTVDETDPSSADIKPEREAEAEFREIGPLVEALRADARAEWCQLCNGFAARLSKAAAVVLGDVLSTHGTDILAARARAILKRVPAPEIELAAAPDAVEAVRASLAVDFADDDIPIIGDDALEPGQLRLAWDDGGAEVDLTALRRIADGLLRTPSPAPIQEEPG